MRNRAWRRAQMKRMIVKRQQNWKLWGWEPRKEQLGRFRKTHFGCGCIMCKPWKYNKKSWRWKKDRLKSYLKVV